MRSFVLFAGCVLASVSVAGQSLSQHPLETMSKSLPTPLASSPLTFANTSDQHSTPVPNVTSKVPTTGQHSLGAVSDWSQHHVLFPTSRNLGFGSKLQNNPRFVQSWYLRHRTIGGPGSIRARRSEDTIARDWHQGLGTVAYQPIMDFNFSIGVPTADEVGYGSVNTLDEFNTTYGTGGNTGTGLYYATGGTLTVTASGLGTSDVGTYPLFPIGPVPTVDPCTSNLEADNLLETGTTQIDSWGLLFGTSGANINLWNTGTTTAGPYDYWNCTSQTSALNSSFQLNTDPGGGQTFPAKFNFDLTGNTPSCAGDYVAIGIPANAVAGSQANIIGYNNLYTNTTGTGLCPTLTNSTVLFAYASGSGEVPGSISLSLDGTKLAYVENQFPSSTNSFTPTSFFHVLTWVSGEGTSATTPVVPDAGNDLTAQLTPDSGTTNQNSTTSPFIDYTTDTAYVTTYSYTTNTGYLYKISPVFGGGTPAIVWSTKINGAVPSSPVYDTISGNVYFTDTAGNIDYVTDEGTTASTEVSKSVTTVVPPAITSANPVTVDSVDEVVYATFNTNTAGTTAVLAQAPVNLSSVTIVPIGTNFVSYTGPYDVDFNNAWYTNGPDNNTGVSTPVAFVTGKGAGTSAMLFAVPFTSGGAITATGLASTTLSTGLSDSSPVTEFFNANNSTDYLFVGVTNDCEATTNGGTAGCVMGLNITTTDVSGAASLPAVTAATTAIPALGGSTGIVIDNDDDTDSQTANIYYATKNGDTPSATVVTGASNLVKATQSGLN